MKNLLSPLLIFIISTLAGDTASSALAATASQANKPDSTGGGGVRVSCRFDSLVNQIFDANDLMRSVFAYRINYVSDDILAGLLGNKKLRQTMDLFHKHTGCGVTIRAQMGQGGVYAALFTPHKNHGVTSQNPESDFNFNISLMPVNNNGTVCKATITWSTGFYSKENMQWHYDNTKISPSSYETFALYMKDSVLQNISLPYMESINTYLVNAISILMGDKASIFDAEIYLSDIIAIDSFNLSEIWHSAKKGQTITVSGNIYGDSINCILKDNSKSIAEIKDSTFRISVQPSAAEHHYKITTALITQAQANLAVYNEEEYKIVLVPLSTASADAAGVEQAINTVYKPAVVKFNVSINNSLRDYNKDVTAENIAPEEIYHSSMQDVITALKNKIQTEKKTFYLFLLPNFKNNSKNVSGYMPYKSQFGFIDMTASREQYSAGGEQSGTQNSGLYKTIAHELAHGIFGLEHTTGNIPFGQNLLDYSESTALCKFQWDIIHDPHAGETDMDDPEEAMLQWRNIVWLTDILYGFAPDEQENETEKYLPILQTVENNYKSYIGKNAEVSGWNISAENKKAWLQKDIYSLYKHIREKSNHTVTQKSNSISIEQYQLNGKNYTLALYSFDNNPFLAYSNIVLQGYASLKNNLFIRAGYTKKSGFIVFYKNGKPSALLQCISTDEPKIAVKNILNYMLLVEQNSGQKKKDEELVFYWKYLAENTYSKTSVENFWTAEDNATQIDLSADIEWLTQMSNSFVNSGCCSEQNTCCRCACVEMITKSKKKATPNSSYPEQILAIDADVLNQNCSNITTDYEGLSDVVRHLDISLFEHKTPMMVTVYHPKVLTSNIINSVKTVKTWEHKCSGNTPGANSHFIVVTGKKYDPVKKQYYYTFLDPGTSNNEFGTSDQNRLYISDDNIIGQTHYTQGGGYYYQLTGVRKNLNYVY
ncbi:MAG: hypothetical protein LBC49_05350 [Bacteroidales bacterium]|jgi:hypothetical protein|nr:hypothetical protein [Bacteroidales bacterium]